MYKMTLDTVPNLFFNRVEKYKDRVALRKKEFGIWNKITWRQYGTMVRQVGMGLVALGLKPKDRVAIIGDSRPEWLYADLGNLSVNGISVGVYTTCSSEEVKYHLSHSSKDIGWHSRMKAITSPTLFVFVSPHRLFT